MLNALLDLARMTLKHGDYLDNNELGYLHHTIEYCEEVLNA